MSDSAFPANSFPDMYIRTNQKEQLYIDFTDDVWQTLLKIIRAHSNTAVRQQAAKSVGNLVNQEVLVNVAWFKKGTTRKTWADLYKSNPTAQAFLIAAYGDIPDDSDKCENSPGATDPTRPLPFREVWVIDNFFSSACANCALKSQYQYCHQNRMISQSTAAMNLLTVR
jgi:hypothetical protein